jgi:hypothetical protein
MKKVGATLLFALCASCGGVASGSPSTHPSVAVTESPTATPTPRLSAPMELQGSWEATISTGEHVILTFRPSGYTVNRAGAQGSGSIDVEGSRITFASARCELGSGSYEWAIEGGTLTFTPLEPRDPCGNRIIFLEDAAYTRVE